MLPADRVILTAAAEIVGRLMPLPPVIVVEIHGGPTRLHFEGPPPQEPPMPAQANGDHPTWRFFSPLEEALLAVLRRAPEGEWWTADRIIVEAGGEVALMDAKEVGFALRNLRARAVIESKPGKGYRATSP